MQSLFWVVVLCEPKTKMNYNEKLNLFLEIAKVLNKNGIIPTIYGSLGLYRLVDQTDDVSDIDILIPAKYAYIGEKLSELVNIMNEMGFKQEASYPNEFFKDGENVEFGLEEELKEFIDIDITRYDPIKFNGAEFRELSVDDYLKIYKAVVISREQKVLKAKSKLQAIEKFIKNE